MKKERILSAALMAAITLGIAVSCAKQDPAPVDNPNDNPQEQVKTNPSVISANIPEEITKVAISDLGVGNGMSLAWETGDAIRVIATAGGSGNESFSIKSGFTATQAEFEGTAVAGTAFTVFYPASYADVAAINARSYVSQEQDGNGSVAHLEWNAIEDVADYGTVTFSNKQNGALRFTLQLPADFTKVYSLSLYATNSTDAPLSVFSTTNGGGSTTDHMDLNLKDGANSYITLGADKVLTVYMMVSWNDNALPAGTKLLIKVKGDQDEPWIKTKEVTTAFTIAGGKVTNIKLNDDNWDEPLFWGGDGTQTNPYIIRTAYHLRNVKVVMDADPTTGLYFLLDNDIDLGNTAWEQVNQVDPHTPYTIYFDGNNHTISNFSIAQNPMGLSSFFGEIGGEVKDLAFSNATIETGGSNGSAGVLCGIANGLTVTNVDATNVDITITNNCGETTGVGGLIGYAVNSTISGCDLSGCDIDLNGTDTQNVGGLIGRLRAEASSVTDCSVANATISARYCAGGLIGKVGCTTGPVDIKGNTTSSMTVSFRDSESGSKQGAGGLIGLIEATGDPAVSVNVGDASNTNTVTNLTINQTQGYVGGVVGNIMDGNVTITKATVDGNIATTGYYAAGVLGRSSKPASISYCDVDATISAGMGAGGVLGYVYEAAPTISHCTVAGSVTAANNVDLDGLTLSHAGGIAGFTRSTSALVEYCDVTADVTGVGAVGGITGRNKGGTIDHCTYSNGTITGTNRVGGISGANTGTAGTFTNNTVSGATINGGADGPTGGILGRNHNGGTTITNCSVSGTSILGPKILGGIVGEAGGAITITSCKTIGGEVKGNATNNDVNYLGGIAGNMNGTITKCYSTTDVTYKSNRSKGVGGFVGGTTNNTTITESYFAGKVYSFSQAGGLIGVVTKQTTIENCYIAGLINNWQGYFGGMAGYINAGITFKATNCYATIEIYSGDSGNAVGGFIGGAGVATCTYDVSGLLAWHSSISYPKNNNTTDGVIIGKMHSAAQSSGTTSFTNCWYRNDLSYSHKNGRTPGSETSNTTGGTGRFDGTKAADGVTCQDKAIELGWDSSIWKLDNTDGYPTLKNVVE
ncbi:MAG: hypothetical protein K6A64_03250 [Bacteroidales bacterium]|nr:hypothetical protein [Bacteroidales bacterium]